MSRRKNGIHGDFSSFCSCKGRSLKPIRSVRKGDYIKMPKNFRLGWVCVLFFLGASYVNGQTIKVPAARPSATSTVSGVAAAGATPTVPANLAVTGGSNIEIDLTWDASTEEGGAIKIYKIYDCRDKDCKNPVEIGSSLSNSYSDTGLTPETLKYYRVVALDAKDTPSAPSQVLAVKTATAKRTSRFDCWWIPTRTSCMNFRPINDVDDTTNKYSNINTFYQTTGSYSFFNQIKSTYNGASGSALVSADLATLNFPDGMQLTVTTNAQAGSSGTSAVSTGTVPTLAANGAGQATQNVLYGGTFVVSEIYPLFASGSSKWGSPGGVGMIVDLALKEGADIQNFKSGTNVNVSSPPFHGGGQIEGYVQYNSINLTSGTQHFAGSLFLGGSYGYTYMSRGYARDYGFGNQVNNGIGQVSFGVLINGVAKITVSRAFGPSQTYIDSTTMARTTVNNFKSWSFGIAYQAAPPSK
jgi:hypothetical protein